MLDQNVPNPLAKNPNFHTHKVFAAIGLILIGVILAVAGIWWYVENQSGSKTAEDETTTTKVSTSSAAKSETDDWKIYTNSSFGYSIKYPIDWLQEENKDKTVSIRNFDPTSKPPEDPTNNINYPKDYINLSIFRVGKETGSLGDFTAKEWYENLGTQNAVPTASSQYFVTGTLVNFKVNGLSAKKVKSKFDETNEVIIILKEPYIFEIYLYPYGAIEDQIIERMLSTFKFL